MAYEVVRLDVTDVMRFSVYDVTRLHIRSLHRRFQIHRLNSTNVVGTFPNPEALLRLTGHVLIEQHDEWDAAQRRYFSENSMKLLTRTLEGVVVTELNAA